MRLLLDTDKKGASHQIWVACGDTAAAASPVGAVDEADDVHDRRPHEAGSLEGRRDCREIAAASEDIVVLRVPHVGGKTEARLQLDGTRIDVRISFGAEPPAAVMSRVKPAWHEDRFALTAARVRSAQIWWLAPFRLFVRYSW
jgi:hypothetical protein